MDHPLDHRLRRAFQRGDGGDGTVFMIRNVIKRGNIYPLYLRRRPEEPGLVPVFPLGPAVEVHQLRQKLLALADEGQGDEVRHRLGVVHGGASGDDQGGQAGTVLRPQGQAPKVQHIQHGGIGHFVAHGKADNVKLPYGVAGLQGVEGDVVFPQLLLHVGPGCEDPFAPYAWHPVEDPVEDAEAQVGHADLIGVREAEGESGVHLALVLHDRVVFPAGVPCGLLHPGQDAL